MRRNGGSFRFPRCFRPQRKWHRLSNGYAKMHPGNQYIPLGVRQGNVLVSSNG